MNWKVELRGGASHERLGAAEGLVVFLRRDVTPGDSANNRAFRDRELPARYALIATTSPNGAKIVEVAYFVSLRGLTFQSRYPAGTSVTIGPAS